MPDEQTPQTPPEQTPEALKETIATVKATATAGDQAIPLEVKLSTGHVFRGSTQEELVKELAKAQENATKLIKEQRDELERLRHVQQQPEPPPTPDDRYDPNRYYQLWQENPLLAQQYLDSFDPTKQAVISTLSRMQYQNDLDTFKQTVNFYPDIEQATTFTNEFVKSGLQPNRDNYELVYYRLVNQGKLNPQVTHIRGQGAPPPSIQTNGSGGGGFDMDQFQSLPADQQAQVIEKLRRQGWT